MELIITERAEEEFVIKDNCIRVYINNLLSFKCENIINYLSDCLVEDLIASDEVFNSFELSTELREDIYAYVLGKIDYEELKERLGNSGFTFCDITVIFTQTRRYFRIYSKIKDNVKNINRVMINCNENNILSALAVAKEIKGKTVILNCGDMKIITCFSIIQDIDIQEYFDANIAIYFKGHSRAIDFYKFFLANRCLARAPLQKAKKHIEFGETVDSDYGFEGPQSDDDEFSLHDILTPSSGVNKISNNKTKCRTRRNKINILN